MGREVLDGFSATDLCRKMFYLRSELRARGWTDDEINRQVAVEITDFELVDELSRFSEKLRERTLFE